MVKRCFMKPCFEVVRFSGGIFTSTCGCYDEDFCPKNYSNCTGDGAGCECGTNHSPALDNCTPCETYS